MLITTDLEVISYSDITDAIEEDEDELGEIGLCWKSELVVVIEDMGCLFGRLGSDQ